MANTNEPCRNCGQPSHCVVNARVKGGKVRAHLCTRCRRDFNGGGLVLTIDPPKDSPAGAVAVAG